VKWKSIAECAAGNEGDELLKRHGDTTNTLYPRVNFIPTVLLNQVYYLPISGCLFMVYLMMLSVAHTAKLRMAG
jgi:hypothetical protein